METGCQELNEDFNYFVKRSSMDKDSLDEEDKRKKNKRKRMKNEGSLGFSKLIFGGNCWSNSCYEEKILPATDNCLLRKDGRLKLFMPVRLTLDVFCTIKICVLIDFLNVENGA